MKQKDVIFSGGDIAIHYHPHVAHWLHLESNCSWLYTNNELPVIPQNRLNNIAKIDFKNKKERRANISGGNFSDEIRNLRHHLKISQS